eukprot:COSAG05_NODE_4166_length_1644_cov_1.187055_2_plen_113_part_01
MHFDDDDFYGPLYIRTMVERLLSHPDAHLSKAHAFFALTERYVESKVAYRCPPQNKRCIRAPVFVRRDFGKTNPRGYGWNYAYWREKVVDLQFTDSEIEEPAFVDVSAIQKCS